MTDHNDATFENTANSNPPITQQGEVSEAAVPSQTNPSGNGLGGVNGQTASPPMDTTVRSGEGEGAPSGTGPLGSQSGGVASARSSFYGTVPGRGGTASLSGDTGLAGVSAGGQLPPSFNPTPSEAAFPAWERLPKSVQQRYFESMLREGSAVDGILGQQQNVQPDDMEESLDEEEAEPKPAIVRQKHPMLTRAGARKQAAAAALSGHEGANQDNSRVITTTTTTLNVTPATSRLGLSRLKEYEKAEAHSSIENVDREREAVLQRSVKDSVTGELAGDSYLKARAAEKERAALAEEAAALEKLSFQTEMEKASVLDRASARGEEVPVQVQAALTNSNVLVQLELSKTNREIARLRRATTEPEKERLKPKDWTQQPRPFDGQGLMCATTVIQFLREVEAGCNANGLVTDAAKAAMARAALRGNALQWYGEFIAANPSVRDHYAPLAVGLMAEFGGGSQALTREFRAVKMAPGERPRDLYRRVAILGEALGYTLDGDAVRGQYWDALPTHLQRLLCHQNIPQTADVGRMVARLATLDDFERQVKREKMQAAAQAQAQSAPTPTSKGRGVVKYVGVESLEDGDAVMMMSSSADYDEDGGGCCDEEEETSGVYMMGCAPGGETLGSKDSIASAVTGALVDSDTREGFIYWVDSSLRSAKRPSSANLLPSNLRCFQCKKEGHLAKDCDDVEAPCYICGGKHHKSRCRLKDAKGISCSYCQFPGHVEGGCRRKRDGLPRRTLTEERYNRNGRSAAKTQVHHLVGQRVANGVTEQGVKLPTTKEIAQALREAADSMSTEEEKRNSVDEVLSLYRQDTTSRLDFPGRK